MNAPLETVERFPHTPSDARKVTNAMLLELDWAVGNLSLALHARQMDARTVWIFHTDNGAPGSHGCNWPNRGHKFSFWGAHEICARSFAHVANEPNALPCRGRRERSRLHLIAAAPGGETGHQVRWLGTPLGHLPHRRRGHCAAQHRRRRDWPNPPRCAGCRPELKCRPLTPDPPVLVQIRTTCGRR